MAKDFSHRFISIKRHVMMMMGIHAKTEERKKKQVKNYVISAILGNLTVYSDINFNFNF